MKQLFAVVVAILLVCGMVFAQDMQMKGTQAGDESINFTFGGLGGFTLGAAGAGTPAGISGTYFLSGDAAVRIGLQVASTSTTNPYTGPGTGTDGSTSSFGAAIGADYLMFMKAGSRVRPYLGGGIIFMMASMTSESPFASGGTTTKTAGGPGTGITFGVSGLAGAEFFLYPEISVSGEYALNLININSPSDSEVTSGGTTTTTKAGGTTKILGFSAAGATIHIYF